MTVPRISCETEWLTDPVHPDFENTYLVSFDFDGNVGDTFSPSPSGVGVEENYEDTLGQIFGDDVLKSYRDGYDDVKPGLDNRSPSEVIEDLSKRHPEVINLAKEHLDKNGEELVSVMPRTINKLGTWDDEPLKAATEVYIRQDLINSLGHIGLLHEDGTPWPRPCNGYEVLSATIQELNATQSGFQIITAIISSGYDEYIDKVFEVWGLTKPDIWVTDDTTRSRPHPTNHKRRVKPAPLPLALAHHEWLKLYSGAGENFRIQTALESKNRMVFFGDGAKNDGQMAARSRIGFGLFDRSVEGVQQGQYTTFGDWREIEKRLSNAIDEMKNGSPLASALGLKIPEIVRA